jgi:hypothetical protein
MDKKETYRRLIASLTRNDGMVNTEMLKGRSALLFHLPANTRYGTEFIAVKDMPAKEK